MIQDDKSTLTIILGKQTISGTKSASGAYKNPNAKVEIYDKNLSIDVPKGTSKLILKSLFEYEEATTKKDIPNFLFALKDKNGKVFAKKSWSDPDIFYKFEEFSGELIIEIDLQKFYSDEESSWKPNAPRKKTASASGDADLEFGLPKVVFPGAPPEINLDIFPTHSPGKDLKNVDVNADWGQPYFLKVNLDNKSNNQVVSGGFDLFEDNKKIKSASLEKPLDSKWKTLVISEDGATWVLIKGPKDWTWYEDDVLGKFKLKSRTNKIYSYFVTGKTIDEFGFKFDLKTDELSANVRVPDYKIKAMDTYNWVVGAEWSGLGLTAVLFAALALLSKGGIKSTATRGTVAVLSGAALRELARQVKTELKTVMDDPPTQDGQYKKIYIAPQTKRASTTVGMKFRRINSIVEFKSAAEQFLRLSKAVRITNNRLWTAKIKKNRRVIKAQNKKHKYYENEFFKSSGNMADKINRVTDELMKLKQTRQIKNTIHYLKILAKKFYALSESLK